MRLLTFSILLVTGLVLVRCSNYAAASPTPENLTCMLQNGTNFNIERCENNEAVCFITEQGGIACKWK